MSRKMTEKIAYLVLPLTTTLLTGRAFLNISTNDGVSLTKPVQMSASVFSFNNLLLTNGCITLNHIVIFHTYAYLSNPK